MSRKKIADSIIIRVGGGIREVSREPAAKPENPDALGSETGLDAPAKVVPLDKERLAENKGGTAEPSA